MVWISLPLFVTDRNEPYRPGFVVWMAPTGSRSASNVERIDAEPLVLSRGFYAPAR